jgi:ABC-type amino acid transport substrate-binding protein
LRNAARVVAFFFPAAALIAQPASADGESLERGRDRYRQACAQCHGHNLVNAGVTSYDLRRFPPDQRERFRNSVANGNGNMPAFKDALSEAEIENLWVYVRARGIAQDPLAVCVAEGNVPYAARAKGAASGFDVALAAAIAARLQRPLKLLWYEVELEKETTPSLEVNALLSAGLCELAAGYVLYEPALGAPAAATARPPDHDGAKPKRQRAWVKLGRLIASEPYQASVLTVVLRPGLGGASVRSLADLHALRTGTVAGSLAGSILTLYRDGALRANLVSLGWRDDPLRELEAGKFDAALIELNRLDAYRMRNAGTRLVATGYHLPLRFNLGFAALESRRELIESVNAILRELQAQGRLSDIARDAGLTHVPARAPLVQPEITLQSLREAGG